MNQSPPGSTVFTINHALKGEKIPLVGGPGDGLTVTYMGSPIVFDPLNRWGCTYECVWNEARGWVYVFSE